MALRTFLRLLSLIIALTGLTHLTLAQESSTITTHTRPRAVTSVLDEDLIPSNFSTESDPASLLQSAILKRIGIPYRFYGADDRGYDCSGFVWRVFQEAGIDFERLPARALWEMFPEATIDEEQQFGTLVFFKGIAHVGIVRDAFSFYHASSSQGVVLSLFTSYWGKRIAGFRRIPLDML